MARRFLTIQLLMLWQGGFLFYAAIVVPIGGQVLGSESMQGFITQRVTNWLNAIGIVALLSLLTDCLLSRSSRPSRKSLVFMAISLQLSLFLLHGRLDSMLDPEALIVLDRPAFYRLHAVYLILSALLWLLMLLAVWQMLATWQESDRIVKSPDEQISAAS